MKDDKSPQPWFVLLVLALLGVVTSGRGGSPGAPPKEGTAAASAKAEPALPEEPPPSCLKGFDAPLRDATGLDPAKVERTVVVTVPDPIDAIGDVTFDRALDAIQRAATALGHYPDRFWLPWSDDRAAARRSEACAEQCDAKREPPCRQTVPGRLLFRGAEGRFYDVLLVGETAAWGVHPAAFDYALSRAAGRNEGPILVVGPTYSGSATSMRDAMARSADARWPRATSFHVTGTSATNPDIGSILSGPSYAPFLREIGSIAAAALSVPRASFVARIGSILIETLAAPRITYEPVVPDDRSVLNGFLKYLVESYLVEDHAFVHKKRSRLRGTKMCFVGDVALLEETGTVYGAGLHAASRSLTPGETEDCPERDNPPVTKLGARCRHEEGYSEPCTGYLPLHRIQYPSHIGGLRRAHEGLGEHDEGFGPHAHVLDPSRAPAEGPGEVVPTFSATAAQSAELSLHQALGELCRQGPRWIGIRGTDALDRLFLAHELRELCPNARLFFVGSDILYAHPGFGADLDGSVVVSAYPLLPLNREWTYPFDGVIAPFAAFADQALYTALLRVLPAADPKPPLEQLPPFRRPENDDARTAPVWVTAVGNGDLWPLAQIEPCLGTECDTDGQAKPAPSDTESPSFRAGDAVGWKFDAPGQWTFWIKVVSIVAALVCAGYGWGRTHGARWRMAVRSQDRRHEGGEPVRAARVWERIAAWLPWGLRWTEVFARPEGARFSLPRLVAGVLCVVPVALVYGLVGWVALVGALIDRKWEPPESLAKAWGGSLLAGLWDGCKEHRYAGPAMLLLAVLLALAVIDVVAVEPIEALRRRLSRSGAAGRRIPATLLVDLALLAASLAIVHRCVDRFPAFAPTVFFYMRTANPSSGLSVLGPAVLVAGALFLCGHQALARLQEPPPDPGDVAFAGSPNVEAACKNASAALDRSLGWSAGSLLAGLVALAVALVLWSPFLEGIGTLGGKAWDPWLWGFSFTVLLGAIWALLSFAAGWRRLAALLDLYAASRLAPAFARLPNQLSKQLGGLLLVRPPHVPQLAPLVILLRSLAEDDSALNEAADDAEACFALGTSPTGPAVRDGTLSATYAALADAAQGLRGPLERAWQAEPFPKDATAAEGEPGGEAKTEGDPWKTAAEDLAARLVVCRVLHVLARLRGALTAATGALLLLLATIKSYPFERQASLVHVVAAVMLVTVGVALTLFVEMEKNEVLSHIHGTTPGKLDWNVALLVKVLLYAGIPLLGVAAASFPAIGRDAFGWMTPLLRLMQ